MQIQNNKPNNKPLQNNKSFNKPVLIILLILFSVSLVLAGLILGKSVRKFIDQIVAAENKSEKVVLNQQQLVKEILPQQTPDTAEIFAFPLRTKEECLEEVGGMNDEELMGEVERLTQAEKTNPTIKGEGMTNIIKQTINYLVCRVGDNKDLGLYNRAKEFIIGLGIQKENEEGSLKRLEEALNSEGLFLSQLALGDLEKICPSKLPRACLKAALSQNLVAEYTVICNNICNLINQYSEDQEKLDLEILNFKEWKDDPDARIRQYKFRTAVAYRFGGIESALKVCDNVPSNNYHDCILEVNKILSAGCDVSHKENLADLICRG